MKNKILTQLEKIKNRNRLGIMTHIVVGYPSLKESRELILKMAEAGVDFIELQIPFSDPMADGPTIMKANKDALDNGVKVKDAFALMKELSSGLDIPLIFMGYFNTVFNYGVENFCKDAKKAGCSGLIFPDIPLEEEENENFIKFAKQNDLIPIRVLSPASTKERLQKNAQIANGFVYFVGRKGTTGAKSGLDKKLDQNLKNLKKYFKIPIAVGFGISNKSHLKALKNKADIAVIGSALLDIYNNSPKGKGLKAVEKFLKKL